MWIRSIAFIVGNRAFVISVLHKTYQTQRPYHCQGFPTMYELEVHEPNGRGLALKAAFWMQNAVTAHVPTP